MESSLETGWYIELEDSAKVLFQWLDGQRYIWIGEANV